MITTITPETRATSTFFTNTDVGTGIGVEDADSFVDVPSRYMRTLGLYYSAGTVPTEQVLAMVSANSRNVGPNSSSGR